MRMTKTRAHTEMLHELERLQEDLRAHWLYECLPADWHGLDTWAPTPRHKTRVTLRLDADMVKWFRNTGPGFGARINAVLRIYWLGLLSGDVKAHLDDDSTPRLRAYARDLHEKIAREREEREQHQEAARRSR